jgi:acetyl-CoA carboxylase carboxyltransferase component
VVFGGLSEKDKQTSVEKMIGDLSPYPAAGAYYLQDIIDPRDTRDYLKKVLKIIRDSKNRGMSEHHLSNWPTKF